MTVGSLAPHDPSLTQNGQQNQQWIVDPATHCIAADPNYDPDDSITWQGGCRKNGMIYGEGTLTFLTKGHVVEIIKGIMDGMPQPGHVVATWSDGAKYEGDQLGFLFNGTGKFVSAKGETFDGEWKLGVLNGKASAVWANGDSYKGNWKNGKPDGQGVEVWADGRRYEGEWRDGVPVGNVQADSTTEGQVPTTTASEADTSAHASAPVGAAAQPAAPSTVKAAKFVAPVANTEAASAAPPATKVAATLSRNSQVANALLPLRSLMGVRLMAVDGATLELRVTNDGFDRTLALPNGNSQAIEFDFASGPVGTVSNEEKTIGVFRARPSQLDIDYADGTTESIGDAGNGGLFDRARTADGRALCTAWYPQDHVFSDPEKKAAVQEYANRLGVSVASPIAKHAAHASDTTCGGAFIAAGGQHRPADANAANPGSTQPAAMPPAGQRAALDAQAPPPAARDAAVAVGTSAVHLVNNPAASAPAAAHLEQASFTPGAASAAVNAVPAGVQPAAHPGASDCLSVSSNGEYWGFQNRCAKSVQFAYCEMSAANPLTACTHTSVSGSVAANSFSALVSDRSLSEQSVDHEFRWMACEGGAGEVVPHLDKFDPPSGRCERAVPAPE